MVHRRRRSTTPAVSVDLNRAPVYNPLSDDEIELVLQGTFELMRESGIYFEPEERSTELFTAAGCEISPDGIVKFPTQLVRDCLDSAARSIKLWDRNGAECIELETGNTHFFAGLTCINVLDLETGKKRPSSRQDLEDIVRVADALPNISGVTLPCKIVERSDRYGEIEEFSIMCRNTTKPLEYLCENESSLEAAIEMACAIRGGADRLREKPYFIHGVTPLPLRFPKEHIHQVFRVVENDIPLGMGTVTIGGATTPITIAGSLVHAFAGDFAGLVLSQLIRKGSFCLLGTNICFMDPVNGDIAGYPHTALAEMAQSQILRHLGLPMGFAQPGFGEGHFFNQEVVSRATATMMLAFYGRPTTCDVVGSIDGALTYSLQSLVLSNDLIETIRTMYEGIRVDQDTLALEVSKAVGPLGDFLAQEHTVRHCRQHLWNTRYYRSKPGMTAADEEELDLVHRIDEDLHRILAEHKPPPLPDATSHQFDEILARWGVT